MDKPAECLTRTIIENTRTCVRLENDCSIFGLEEGRDMKQILVKGSFFLEEQ